MFRRAAASVATNGKSSSVLVLPSRRGKDCLCLTLMTGTADKCVMFEDPAVYWLDSHRLIAVFKDLLGVRMVVWRGRLVMGLVLFFPLNQLWMEVRS